MPVLVTGAHRPLARRLAAALLAEGGEVRAHGIGDTAALRAAGAIVAPGTADDEGHLEASLEQVHTAVHVGRGMLAPAPEVLVNEAAVLTRAAANAGVKRLIVLSVAGADPDAPDPLRAAAGSIEEVVADAAVPSVALRLSLVDTPAIRDALATAGLSADEREVEVAPLRVEDVVELVVAFDRARSSARRGHATFVADGAAPLGIGDYLDRVGVARPGRGGLVGRRALDPTRVPMLLPSLRGPWTQRGSDLPDAWSFTRSAPAPIVGS